MKALIQRRPSQQYGAYNLLFPVFFNGLLVVAAYAVHALQGTSSSVWMSTVWAASAGIVTRLVADNDFQQQWLRLLRLRVPSVHVQRWVVGHFQMLTFWAGFFCLSVLCTAPLSGFTVQQGSALVGLSMVGWPLYGLAGLARMGHGPRWVRWPWLMYPVSMFAWASSWLVWQYWGKDQGWWLPLTCLLFSLIGLWALMQRMLRLGEPAPADFAPAVRGGTGGHGCGRIGVGTGDGWGGGRWWVLQRCP